MRVKYQPLKSTIVLAFSRYPNSMKLRPAGRIVKEVRIRKLAFAPEPFLITVETKARCDIEARVANVRTV